MHTIIKKTQLLFSEPRFYITHSKKRLKSNLILFFTWMTIFGIIYSLNFIFIRSQVLKNHYNQFINYISPQIPNDLVFTWDKHKLITYYDNSTNTTYDSPIKISAPQELNTEIDKKNLISYVNVDKPFSDFPKEVKNSVFVMNQTHLYMNTNSTQESNKLENLLYNYDTFNINSEKIKQYLEQSKLQFTNLLDSLKYLTLIIFPLGLITLRLLVVFQALIIYLFFNLTKQEIKFNQIFKLCLNVAIPAQLIDLITNLSFPNNNFSMFSISFWIIFTVVWISRSKKTN